MFYPPRRTAQSLLLLAIAALGRDACQDGSCARPAQPLSLLQNKRVHLKAATASDDVEEQAAEDDSETPVVDEPTKTASLQQRWVRGKQHGAQSSPPAAETNATARHVEPAIGAKQDLSISPRPTVLPQHQQALTNSNVTLAPERLESLTPGATHEEAWRAGVGAPQGHWAEDQYPSSSSGRISSSSSKTGKRGGMQIRCHSFRPEGACVVGKPDCSYVSAAGHGVKVLRRCRGAA